MVRSPFFRFGNSLRLSITGTSYKTRHRPSRINDVVQEAISLKEMMPSNSLKLFRNLSLYNFPLPLIDPKPWSTILYSSALKLMTLPSVVVTVMSWSLLTLSCVSVRLFIDEHPLPIRLMRIVRMMVRNTFNCSPRHS